MSRRRVDVCLLDEGGEVLAETAVPPDADGLRGLVGQVAFGPIGLEDAGCQSAKKSRVGRRLDELQVSPPLGGPACGGLPATAV